MDDVIISCDPILLDHVWPLWISTLADHGLQVEPSKCKAWVPSASETNPNIEAHVPIVLHGLPVLGMAAQSEHSCLITLPTAPASANQLLADANKTSQRPTRYRTPTTNGTNQH